ncbi:antitoxin [Candidatus Palauibacter sp.]|uniref:antitoxin n=1 Tax=Candidatus Palauibacter sp. TaxID=3101350 RepID=UPI003B5B5759
MRTTLNLDSDVHRAVKSIARERGASMGSVVSTLVRSALRPENPGFSQVGGFPVFEVREGAPPITPEMVADALEET